MKNIIIFPGQGYFDVELLNKKYVEEFCYKYEIDDIFELVRKDKNNIHITKYAQVLIVAVEVAQFLEYCKKNNCEDDILIGYSLGEVSSLISAGVLDIKEGINFVRARGENSEIFYKEKLYSKKYTVGKVPFEENIEEELRKEGFEIINYVPDFTKTNTSAIIIGKEKDKIFEFMKAKRKNELLENLHISELSCPFHTNLMVELQKEQIRIFDQNITKFDAKMLTKIFCTRTATLYKEISKQEINKSLAEYLISPINTKKTMEYLEKSEYKNRDILVTMGRLFIADHLKEQCDIIGLNGNINDISNLI